MTQLRRLGSAIADASGGLVLWIPGGIGSRLRRYYYQLRGARVGRGTRLEVGVMIDNPRLVEIGSHSWIDRFAVLIAGLPRSGRETREVGAGKSLRAGIIRIGDRCHIGVNTVLSGIGGLDIGDDVTVAAGTKIYSFTHHYRSWSRPGDQRFVFGSLAEPKYQSMLQGPVRLGTNVGVGVDCLILPGVSIGERSFVRPHSVVGRSFDENSLVAGNPAAREGDRFQPVLK